MFGGWKVISGKEVQKRDEWEMSSGRAAAVGGGQRVCLERTHTHTHTLRHHYRALVLQSRKRPK
jgi:hypothetical protein